MLRTQSVNIGKYVAEVTKVQEEKVGGEKNISVVKVYFKPKDKTGTVYSEKALCIFSNFDEYIQEPSYKFMDILDELKEKDIDCDRIQEKSQGKKFVITIGVKNGYKNIVDIRLHRNKKQRISTIEEEP